MSDHLDETTGLQTVEVTCQRSVGGSSFAAGIQDFNWTIARPNVWSPADSYFVLQLEVLGPGDPTTATQPKISDMLALAENAGNSLYTNAYFHCGGQVVSSVTQYHAQLGALSARMGNTAAWSKSIGEGAYNDMASFSERVAALSVSNKRKTTGGTNHPLGISLINGKEEIYKPCTAGDFSTANVEVSATGQVTGTGTNFVNADIGNFLFVDGEKLQIIDWFGPTNITVQTPDAGITPGTTSWYIVRRNASRTTQGHNNLQIIFRPPLGIFGSNALMGPGSYKISLSPDANYRFAAIETVNEDAKGLTPGVGATSPYTLNILDCKFYATTAQKLLPEGPQPPLHLMEYQAFSRTMNGTQGSFNFTVPVSTEEIFVFLQHPSAGTNPVFPPSKFVAANNGDLNLAAIQCTYAGQTKPQTRWESGFKDEDPAGRNKSYLTHLYYQQLIESNRCCDQGGAESLDEWLQRGPVFAFRFDKDATSRETEVNLQVSYNDPKTGVGFATDSKVFVVARYRTVRQIVVSDGQIVSVIGLEA